MRNSSTLSESLFDAIEFQSRENPNQVALIFEDRQITYAQLRRRIGAIAEQLMALNLNKGDKVALLFPNHPEFVAAFFAVVGLGAVVVPVNPLLKSEEIAHVLSDSHAKVLIVYESGIDEVVKAFQIGSLESLAHILLCRHDSEKTPTLPAGLPVKLLNTNQSPSSTTQAITQVDSKNDLALIVYTSGTTGKPKGAMLTHDNLISALKESLFDGFNISSNDRFLGVLPLCHIYGAGVLVYTTIAYGSSLVILPKFEPAKALEAIGKHRVTVVPLVPAMYQFILMELQHHRSHHYELSSVRLYLCAAAPLPADLHEQAEAALHAEIVEGYGMSETACGGTLNPPKGRKRGSIGKPISCLEIMIRSDDGKALPPGKGNIGEIAIKGPNVMQGYFEKPDASKESFVDGWFLTGDLGYQDEDGYLYVSGRKKELIIRGGSNIYPREVEEVIARMPEVQDVAVVGVPDKLMGERVKAVIVTKAGTKLSEEDVKDFCSTHLASYKVPRLVEFRTALPRNSTGKILKRELV